MGEDEVLHQYQVQKVKSWGFELVRDLEVKSKGIRTFAIVLIVVVVAIVATVGYYLVTRRSISGVISIVEIQPSTAIFGERLTVTVTVRNNSEVDAHFNLLVNCSAPPKYSIGESKLAEYIYVPKGETATRSFSFYPTFYENFVKITVDLRTQEDLKFLDEWVTQIELVQ